MSSSHIFQQKSNFRVNEGKAVKSDASVLQLFRDIPSDDCTPDRMSVKQVFTSDDGASLSELVSRWST